MTPLEAFEGQLGRGTGYVYVTAQDGVFPCTDDFSALWGIPQVGIANVMAVIPLVKTKAAIARKSVAGSHATTIITITNAAADNLTVLTVGGVAQIGGAVAMTAGDTTASALSVANAMNAFAAAGPYDWQATSVGNKIYLRCPDATSAANDQAVTVTFSGASTATTYNTGGGSDAGDFQFRVFVDSSTSATASTLAGSAVEITEAIAALPPFPVQEVAIVSAAITIERKDRENYVKVTGGGTIDDIIMPDAQYGDLVTVYCKDGEAAVTIRNSNPLGLGNIAMSVSTDYVSTGEFEAKTFCYRIVGGTPVWAESDGRDNSTPTNNRESGSFVPLVAGVATQAMNLAGAAYTYNMGDPAQEYSVQFTGSGNLTGNITVSLAAGADILAGDEGSLFGNGSSVTYTGAFTITVGGIVIPASVALSGNWKVFWIYDGAAFRYNLVSNITDANIVGTSQIQNLAVTDAKIASGVSGSKITAGTVPFTALDASTQALFGGLAASYTTVDIATGDVLTLNTSPVDVAAMPAVAGQAYVVLYAATQILSYAGVAYNAGDVIWLKTFGATVPQMIDNNTLQATVATMRKMLPNDSGLVAAATQVIANAKMQVTSSADPTLGTSDIRVHIWYIAIPL